MVEDRHKISGKASHPALDGIGVRWGTLGATIPAYDIADREATIGRTRQSLEESESSEAWTSGQSPTDEEVAAVFDDLTGRRNAARPGRGEGEEDMAPAPRAGADEMAIGSGGEGGHRRQCYRRL